MHQFQRLGLTYILRGNNFTAHFLPLPLTLICYLRPSAYASFNCNHCASFYFSMMSGATSPRSIHRRSSSFRVINAEEGRATTPSHTISGPQQTGRSDTSRSQLMADRFLRRGKRKVGVGDSLKAIAFSSCTSILFGLSDFPLDII